jgi:hypothetical protein
MSKPVLAYHAVFSAYGFWLPKDPRGSWSDFVGSWDLFHAAGKATKTDETRSLARNPHDRELRLKGKAALSRPPVKFTGLQARSVGVGFANAVAKSGLTIWACSILSEHVHLVVARSHLMIEQVVTAPSPSTTSPPARK